MKRTVMLNVGLAAVAAYAVGLAPAFGQRPYEPGSGYLTRNPPPPPGLTPYGPRAEPYAGPIDPHYPVGPPRGYPEPGGLWDDPFLGQYPFLPPDGRSRARYYHRGYAPPPFAPAPRLSAVVRLSERLAAQADEFLQAFVHVADEVPQGQRFLADATSLRDAAARLAQAAAAGAPPDVLAGEFRNVAARWERLESRMAAVSRGRIGPNIATALQMGGTIEEIARRLP